MDGWMAVWMGGWVGGMGGRCLERRGDSSLKESVNLAKEYNPPLTAAVTWVVPCASDPTLTLAVAVEYT